MSRWTDQFKSHPIHVELNDLGAALQDLTSDDPATADELARLRKVHAFTVTILDGLDPEIVVPSLLNNMHSYVRNSINEMASYRSAPAFGYLQSANNHFDSIITFIGQTPIAPSGLIETALERAALAYSEAMTQHAERFRETLQTSATAMDAKYIAVNVRSDAASENVSKLETRVSGMEAQLPTLLAGFNTTFQNSETQRSSAYDLWTTGYQSKLDDQFALAASKFGTGEKIMDEQLARAEKVLGSVVDTAQAGAYATYANEERKSANNYRRFAIGLMAAAAMVLFLPELLDALRAAGKYAVGYTLDWKKALYRLPFSLILFTPAVYLARESSRHRTNEVMNRRRQHILTTIGPYLALLEPKRAEEIKTDVAKSIFKDNPSSPDDRALETSNLLGQLTTLVATILKGKQ